MADQTGSKINLIVPGQNRQAGAHPSDRKGGQEHGIIGDIRRYFAEPVDAEKFAENLSKSLSSATDMVKKTLADRLGEFAIDEITLSLAVTSEGTIGIATAGVEASIGVTLKRKDEDNTSS